MKKFFEQRKRLYFEFLEKVYQEKNQMSEPESTQNSVATNMASSTSMASDGADLPSGVQQQKRRDSNADFEWNQVEDDI